MFAGIITSEGEMGGMDIPLERLSAMHCNHHQQQ